MPAEGRRHLETTRNARRRRLDRLRLYVITGERGSVDETAAIVAAALAGGADAIQLRKKTMAREDQVRLARRLRALTRAHDALLIINDHPLVAIEADADGVHLGQDDADPREVRDLFDFGDRLIGRSTHSREQAHAAIAEGADYLGVGPVFATPTKPGRAPVGLELVRAVSAAVPIPFVAIGGIDERNVASVIAAGARAIAVVRAVYDSEDPAEAARRLRREAEKHVGAPVS